MKNELKAGDYVRVESVEMNGWVVEVERLRVLVRHHALNFRWYGRNHVEFVHG